MTSRPRPPRLLAITALCLASLAGMGPAQPETAAPPQPPLADSPAQPAGADLPEVTLYLKDGQRFTGLLVSQSETKLVVRIGGIDTTFLTDQVERFETLQPIAERYKEIRDAVGDDPEQLVKLAEWLRARERYELALEEIERALKIDPTNAEASRAKVMLTKLIELRAKSGQGVNRQPRPSTDPAPAPEKEFPLLTQEQINLLKVYEVDLKKPGRLVIDRATLTRVLEKNAGHPLIPVTKEGREALYRRPPAQILDLMFRLQARDFYPEIQVLDAPKAFELFRDNVNRAWLVNSCATTACHGGAGVGRLALYPRKPSNERSYLTNLVILERYRLDDGTPLINFDEPAASPLLQLALDRNDSRFPHPEVPLGPGQRDGWRPVFRNADDSRFRDAVEWIQAMYQPHPEYPVNYTPPLPSKLPDKAGEPGGQPEPVER